MSMYIIAEQGERHEDIVPVMVVDSNDAVMRWANQKKTEDGFSFYEITSHHGSQHSEVRSILFQCYNGTTSYEDEVFLIIPFTLNIQLPRL